mmetsp:Transcript_9536/g.9313  ORF Transcript_9536/g.9313 Transcript_9536/m.9313 type:complete len:89 (+) Transcript_9536:255-521(+)|eukprot:CAMPEP_0197004848 /NCGR_PEP_ID=MMETSP1380-20130617/26015_1 /TAXON_ID=5936 /ORGANISM="Euplotes crassus, Strain CT5" /LENGTH=88 /DNA_ID=CAMNT_0042423783 /DNA_START=253 /DNA_END=519 /DNA_ORIENTATION=+
MTQNYMYNIANGQYEQDPGPEGMVGRGGTEKITVSIDRPGKELLQLVYARPWLLYKIDKMDEQGFWDVEPAKATSINFEVYAEADGDL